MQHWWIQAFWYSEPVLQKWEHALIKTHKDSLWVKNKQNNPTNKLTIQPSKIKKWNIYNMEFNAVITKTAFWQNGGLDMTNSTETDQKYWIREREEKKKNPLKCMMCHQESKLYLEARDWLLRGTQRGDKSRELVLPGGHLTTKHIWASLRASGKEERAKLGLCPRC